MIGKFGRNPSPFGAVGFKFSQFFDATALPTPPLVFGHKLGLKFGMLANDQIGDCVVAGGMHETMIWSREWHTKTAPFTDALAIKTYSDIGGYVPGDPSTDDGLDMAMAASYRRKTGLLDANGLRHKIDAYVEVSTKTIDQLALAAYLFGAVGIGIQFPRSAGTQFDREQPWTVVRNSPIEGGHYTPLVGRNSRGNLLVITWGRLQAVAPDFLQTYCDEAVASISLESLSTQGLSPEGFEIAKLRSALASLKRS